MTHPVSVVTGANSGIGRETARGLAEAGHTVVLSARDRSKGEEAVADVRATTGSDRVELVHLDLADLASVRAAAEELRARHPAIHVLVNNAGLIVGDRRTTTDGFEATFGVNHLGPFLLTALLRPALAAAGRARVVTLASMGHKMVPGGLDFDDLMWERRTYRETLVYGASKLANILFTRELARRAAGEGIVAHAVHPGVVATGFAAGGDATPLFAFGMKLVSPFLLSPAAGARTSLHCALSEDAGASSGEFWARRRRARPSGAARDDAAAARLWEVSERLVGLA